MNAIPIPDIFDIEPKCPKPWRFLVALSFSIALYGLFSIGWHFFAIQTMIPGMLFSGSFAVPISATVLFYEFNIRRNVPLYDIVLIVLLGGVLSLLLSAGLLYFDELTFGFLGVSEDWYDSMRAPIEEIAKMIVVVVAANRSAYRYRLNGLLFGAAVGAGFASFESAGYALMQCLNSVFMSSVGGGTGVTILNAAVEDAENTIVARGLLSPFSHVAWSALACAGLWWKRNGKINAHIVFNWQFLILFACSSVLHMAWNAPVELPFYAKYILIGVIAWSIILLVVKRGIDQIKSEQAAILGKVSSPLSYSSSKPL